MVSDITILQTGRQSSCQCHHRRRDSCHEKQKPQKRREILLRIRSRTWIRPNQSDNMHTEDRHESIYWHHLPEDMVALGVNTNRQDTRTVVGFEQQQREPEF